MIKIIISNLLLMKTIDKNNNHLNTIITIISFMVFAAIIVHEIIRYIYNKPIMLIDWIANLLVVVSAIVIRFKIDKEEYIYALQTGNGNIDININPEGLQNFITLSIFLGAIANIIIHFNFISGMILYLLMNISFIKAFSCIVPINKKFIFSEKVKKYNLAVITFWTLTHALSYYLFVFNELKSLIVIPYILSLLCLTVITSLGFSYKKRPLLFRLVPIIASTNLLISDILIGHYAFVNRDFNYYFIISLTYIIAILLFNATSLFSKKIA